MFSIRIAKTDTDMDNFFRLSFETAKTTEGRMFDQLKAGNPDKSDDELGKIHRKEMENYFDFDASDARVFMVEKDDGEYAGYIWVGIRNSEDAWDFQRPLWIYDIVVDPKFRGNGIGKMLLQRAEEFAIELERNIGLFVHEHNKTAIRLYESQDYYLKVIPMSKSLEKISTKTKETGFYIRKETKGDLERIKQLGLRRFEQMVRLSKDAENDQISKKYDDYFEKYDSESNHCRFVAERGNNIAGFVWIGVADFSDKIGLFYDLATDDGEKSQELKENLLDYAEVWSKNSGLSSVYYLLHACSDITEDLLKSQGYSVPGYFMEKELVRGI